MNRYALPLLLVLSAAARADDAATVGAPVPVYLAEEVDARAQKFESLNILSSASDRIRQILELESRTTTVDEAMRIKAQGLQYVRDLEDFDHLCHIRPNASDLYKERLGSFIADHLGNWLRDSGDLEDLARFEARCTKVDQTIRVKELGLRVARHLQDFALICRKAHSPGSDLYKQRCAEFIARYAGNFVRPGDSIETLLSLEGQTIKVDDALQVKTAGLQALTSIEDFQRLLTPAFSNPSDLYKSRRIQFLVANVGRAVQPHSDIQVILALESQVVKVDDAMAVKRAGLAAVQNLDEFLQLTQPAFSNPSDLYRTQLSRFIAQYGGSFGS